MNPIVFAMRHPVTTLMLVVALISGGAPGLQPDAGGHLPLAEHPEDLRLPRLHRHEPRPDGGVHRQPARAVLPVRRRHPGHQHAEHPAGRLVPSSRSSPAPTWARRWPRWWRCPTGRCRGCPRGRLPPMIMRMDAGSVPVGYLVFESKETSLGAMGDLAQNVIRPLVQKFVPGTVAISPFGPNMRSIVINVDPHKLLRLQPDAAAGHRCPGEGEHDHPGGEHLHQGLDAGGRQQRDGRRHPGAWATSRCGWGRTSTSATWRPSRTTPTSPTAMRWSTARSRSTCRSSRRTRARR